MLFRSVRTVNARTYPFLRDHSIGGKPVFPVVLALEWMVKRAQELAPRRFVAAVRDLKVLKGIALSDFDGKGDSFEVKAEPRGDTLAMEIRTPGGPLHYRATVELSDGPPARPSVPAIPTLPAYEHTLAEVYPGLLFHGPAFQVKIGRAHV